MSRSKRKPYVVDGYGTKWKRFMKAYHNRKLRRKLKNPNFLLADGCAHKNGPGLNRWDICDYKWLEPKTPRIISEYWTEEDQLRCYLRASRK